MKTREQRKLKTPEYWHHCPKCHRKLNVSHFPHIFPKYSPSPTPDSSHKFASPSNVIVLLVFHLSQSHL